MTHQLSNYSILRSIRRKNAYLCKLETPLHAVLEFPHVLRGEKRIIKKILTQFLLNRRWERQEWYYSSTGTTRPSSLTGSSSKEYLVSSKSLIRQRKLERG